MMLKVCDLTVVRSLQHEHKECDSCGQCFYCTVPHRCCCGLCGTTCSHQHEVLNSVCFMMQELDHGRERLRLHRVDAKGHEDLQGINDTRIFTVIDEGSGVESSTWEVATAATIRSTAKEK